MHRLFNGETYWLFQVSGVSVQDNAITSIFPDTRHLTPETPNHILNHVVIYIPIRDYPAQPANGPLETPAT
jgi:hypothetical protein